MHINWGIAHSDCGCASGKTVRSLVEHMLYLCASVVVIHFEEAQYQVCCTCTFTFAVISVFVVVFFVVAWL